MPDYQDYVARYGNYRAPRPGKGGGFNKPIRAEIPGGERFLELLEYIHRQRCSPHPIRNPKSLLEEIEDRMQDVKEDMETSLRKRYNFDSHTDHGSP